MPMMMSMSVGYVVSALKDQLRSLPSTLDLREMSGQFFQMGGGAREGTGQTGERVKCAIVLAERL